MEDRYFKFMLTVPPKPIPTHLMIEVFNKVWSWAKKYRNLQNGTKDWSTIKNTIKDTLHDFVYVKTKRNPMIIPIISDLFICWKNRE